MLGIRAIGKLHGNCFCRKNCMQQICVKSFSTKVDAGGGSGGGDGGGSGRGGGGGRSNGGGGSSSGGGGSDGGGISGRISCEVSGGGSGGGRSVDSDGGGGDGDGGSNVGGSGGNIGGATNANNSKFITKLVEPQKIVAFGNVLLDYTAHLDNVELLDRYKLSLNSRAEIDVETLSKVTNEALELGEAKEPHLGGAALNMIRIIKKLGTEPLFFGAVGVEKPSEPSVRQLLHKAGLNSNNFRLQEINDVPTGRCICLTYDNSIALYANVGASTKFSTDFLIKVENEIFPSFLGNSEINKQIYYIEGFFIPQRENVITYIVSNYIKGRRYLAFNLSANYIVKFNYFHTVYLAHHATFIFGNIDEFEIFREFWGANTLEEFIEAMLQNGTLPKILVITNGERGGQIITNYVKEHAPPGDIIYKTYKAAPIEKIVDTTGCGDAFAAAFLHSWLHDRSLDECITKATQVAAKVAGQIGCNLP